MKPHLLRMVRRVAVVTETLQEQNGGRGRAFPRVQQVLAVQHSAPTRHKALLDQCEAIGGLG